MLLPVGLQVPAPPFMISLRSSMTRPVDVSGADVVASLWLICLSMAVSDTVRTRSVRCRPLNETHARRYRFGVVSHRP